MSRWARRRKLTYISGIFGIVAVLIAVPLIVWLYEPASCTDGVQNQGETSPDRGGPCRLLDEQSLIPHATLWARSFEVREGAHSAVAYVENPNAAAGVAQAPYRIRLYDADNVLIAEREGVAHIMPGTVTPVYESRIETGNRTVARTFFEFTSPLVWERMEDVSSDISVSNRQTHTLSTSPRVTAHVENTRVRDIEDIAFVAVAFDTAGNAFVASRTVVPRLDGGEAHTITFTWPEPFTSQIARVDVLPVLPDSE